MLTSIKESRSWLPVVIMRLLNLSTSKTTIGRLSQEHAHIWCLYNVLVHEQLAELMFSSGGVPIVFLSALLRLNNKDDTAKKQEEQNGHFDTVQNNCCILLKMMLTKPERNITAFQLGPTYYSNLAEKMFLLQFMTTSQIL